MGNREKDSILFIFHVVEIFLSVFIFLWEFFISSFFFICNFTLAFFLIFDCIFFFPCFFFFLFFIFFMTKKGKEISLFVSNQLDFFIFFIWAIFLFSFFRFSLSFFPSFRSWRIGDFTYLKKLGDLNHYPSFLICYLFFFYWLRVFFFFCRETYLFDSSFSFFSLWILSFLLPLYSQNFYRYFFFLQAPYNNKRRINLEKKKKKSIKPKKKLQQKIIFFLFGAPHRVLFSLNNKRISKKIF